MEEITIKCSMCSATIEDIVLLSPELIARFYKWNGRIVNRNGILYKYFYCPKHSIEEVTDFEKR